MNEDYHHVEYIKDEFATDQFIADNQHFYDKYIGYRIHGYSSQVAFTRAFGAKYLPSTAAEIHYRLEQMESTDYYITNFEKRLKEISTEKLWNDRLSMHELLSLARSGLSKCSTRLAAVKELNVIANITVETDAGRSKAVKSLSDFYSDQTKSNENTGSLDNKPNVDGAAEGAPEN